MPRPRATIVHNDGTEEVLTDDGGIIEILENGFSSGATYPDNLPINIGGLDPEVMRRLEAEVEAMWRRDSEEDYYDGSGPPIPPFMREKKDESLKIIAEQYVDEDLNCI
jgi:hypothetical protein